KEIAKPITPPSKSASEEGSDPEQARRDKDMQFRNQRTVTVAGARETVGSQVVKQSRIQCFNYKEFGHFTKECRKPKRVKDYTYHKEKMLLCKQTKKGVPLQAEQGDWLEDTDEEIDEQELEAHYGFMARIQEVLPPESDSTAEPLEQVDSNVIPDSPDMCDNDIQTNKNTEDERVALANLIANLTLDTEENKKIINCLIALQCKQTELEKYMTLNDRTVDYDKLERKLNDTLGLLVLKEIDIKEGLKLKAYEISFVKEKHDELVKQNLLTKSHYEGLVKEKTKVITDLKSKEEKDIDKMISMEKQLKFLNEIVYKRNQSIQTIHMLAPKCLTFNGRSTFANPMYLKKAQSKKPCLYEIPYDQSDPANRLIPDREETLTLEKESRSKLNKGYE
ncbi:integrase, catalytic region, zinc finger, CCHC-type containing protein, partial [Tanacetum coccineum]